MKVKDFFERVFGKKHPGVEDLGEDSERAPNLDVPWVGRSGKKGKNHVDLDLKEV